MVKNNIVTIEIDGIEVRGKITHWNRFSMFVKIESPYDFMLTNSGNIPYFAKLSIYYADKQGDLNERGVAEAEYLLKKAYNICKNILSNKEKLIEAYYEWKEKTIKFEESYKFIEELKELKKEYENKFKSGLIPEKDYVKVIKQIKKAKIDKDFKRIDMEEAIFGKYMEHYMFTHHRESLIKRIEQIVKENEEEKISTNQKTTEK